MSSTAVDKADRALVYQNVQSATDAIVTSTRTDVEVMYFLRDASAPRSWTWSVETGAGIGGVRRAPDGGLYFTRKNDEAVWSVPAALAVDETGKRLTVHSEWAEGELKFEIEGSPTAYPVLVDPVVTALFWVKRTAASSPPARVGHRMAYDSRHARTVLFGGADAAKLFGDTWEWDGTTWVERTPATSPSARRSHAMAYDSRRGRVVLFGGADDSINLGDTWEWDDTTWAQRAPANGPLARTDSSMVYDSGRGVSVLFGGSGSPSDLRDAWEWDGATWAQRTVTTSPSPRGFLAMAFDSQRARTVLFGGFTEGDTWEWSGTEWSERTPMPSPQARFEHALAYCDQCGASILFGGLGTPAYADLADTWKWDGSSWARLDIATSPSARDQHAMAYDTNRAQIVLFGGNSSGGETWELGFLHAAGSDCTGDAQCGSGVCSDEVCCNRACSGACDVCRASLGASADGVCTVVPVGSPGSPACGAPLQCNGRSAACPTSCASDADCVPAFYCQVSTGQCLTKLVQGAACPDGDHSCQTGSCLAGICSTCSTDSVCNAGSYCSVGSHGCVARLKNGTACPEGDDSCQSGFCIDGTCRPCRTDAACDAGDYCSPNTHACVARAALATSCPDGDHSCASGFCTDGVCCDARCNELCEACTASLKGSGQDGMCEPIVSGTDPDNECTPDPDYPRSCKADGTCNGKGACRTYATDGTACAPPSCDTGQLTTAECNGAGSCVGKTIPCSGGVACASTLACMGSCATDTDCLAGFTCGADGTCSPSGSSCRDDHTVVDSKGHSRPCAPYKCSGGACQRDCTSVDDCVDPSVCDDTQHCVAPVSTQRTNGGGGCGCRTERRSRPEAVSALLVLAGVYWARRRRERRPRRATS